MTPWGDSTQSPGLATFLIPLDFNYKRAKQHLCITKCRVQFNQRCNLIFLDNIVEIGFSVHRQFFVKCCNLTIRPTFLDIQTRYNIGRSGRPYSLLRKSLEYVKHTRPAYGILKIKERGLVQISLIAPDQRAWLRR